MGLRAPALCKTEGKMMKGFHLLCNLLDPLSKRNRERARDKEPGKRQVIGGGLADGWLPYSMALLGPQCKRKHSLVSKP